MQQRNQATRGRRGHVGASQTQQCTLPVSRVQSASESSATRASLSPPRISVGLLGDQTLRLSTVRLVRASSSVQVPPPPNTTRTRSGPDARTRAVRVHSLRRGYLLLLRSHRLTIRETDDEIEIEIDVLMSSCPCRSAVRQGN